MGVRNQKKKTKPAMILASAHQGDPMKVIWVQSKVINDIPKPETVPVSCPSFMLRDPNHPREVGKGSEEVSRNTK
jgi:hypothetical protein